MKLESLGIRVLPGIDPGFEVELERDAVNVITGPNASGKSSLVRAVRALLWPDQSPDYAELEASWHQSHRTLVSVRRGRQVEWLSDGRRCEAPKLPPPESAGAFLISSEDLSAMGQTDHHIAGHLRTLLAGGYDLDAVVNEGELAARGMPRKLAGELSRLDAEVAAKQSEYAALNEELATLARLHRQLSATADAAGRLRACEDALALADGVARRQALEQTLIDEYPGGMDRLRGDELDRLDQAEARLAERQKELAVEHDALKTARDRLARSGNIDPQTLEALQAELGEQRDRLIDLERRIEQQHEAIAQQQAALDLAARRLGRTTAKPAPKLDQTRLEELEKRVDRVQALREQIRNLTGELARSHVSSNLTGRAQGDLRAAKQALVRWLDGANLSPLEGILWGGLGGAAALAAWRLLGPAQVELLPELVLLILIAVGVPLSLLIHFVQRLRDVRQAEQAFLATDIEPPLGWSESEVEARLERLELELESATRHEISQARATDVRAQLNSQRAGLDQARERLRQLASETGISEDVRLETGFQLWCRHLHDWQNEESGLVRAQARLAQLQQRYQALQDESGELLQRHGMASDSPGGSRELAGLIHLLSPRMRRNAELHQAINGHEHRISELQADITQLERARDQVFEQAGLKAADRDGLIQRVDQYAAWRELEQERRDLSLEIVRLEERLSSEPDLVRQAREQARDALQRVHSELSARVAERDQLNRRVGEIQTRHEALLQGRELEALGSQLAQVREQLEQELDARMQASCAELLIEDVRTAHQSHNEPAALKRAGQWFERFTRHRYRLRFAGERFMALDTLDGRERGISELSTGTRVQLLLAVRLAWIERLESQSESLPVFLDEVLTTTDPDRYRAIVSSLNEIVTDGRQIIYLTAQSDDAQAWIEWAGDGPEPRVIDLSELRRGQVEALEVQMPKGDQATAVLPDPATMPPQEWARAAGVDPISPWRDAGSMHVFHFLQDRLDQVAELIRYDLGRLGELESFLDSAQANALVSREERDRLENRVRAARLILKDWCERHDRPVDDRVLAASGAVSDHFLDRVRELNQAVGRDPGRLIEALRESQVSRFRSDNIDQLEQYLKTNGYRADAASIGDGITARISLKSGLPPEEISQLRAWIVAAINDPLSPQPSS